MEPKVRDAVVLDAKALQQYAGIYETPQFGRSRIRVEGDHLVTSSVLASDLEFYPATPQKFLSLTGDLPEIAFSMDEKGNVTGADLGWIRATKVR